MRRLVEARVGGTAMFLQGCEGDVNPDAGAWRKRDAKGWFSVADGHGERIADAALAVLADASPLDGELGVAVERVVAAPVGDTLLTKLGQMNDPTRDVELIEWDVCGVRLITVPGEGFHGLERAMLEARGDRLLFAGLAPDWHGYLPVPYTKGYEEGLSLGPEGVAAVVDALVHG